MTWAGRHRGLVSWAGGALLPLAVAALLVPVRDSFADAAAALVLIAAVALVAIAGTRTAGYVAAASAGLWFDFFLTRPYERLTITHRPDIEITVSLFVVGVLVTEMAARGRHHLAVAAEEADYVGVLYEISEYMSAGATFDELVSRVSDHLVRLLHLQDCNFEVGSSLKPMLTMSHDGSITLGQVKWPISRWGLPGSQLGLAVHSGGRVMGRFIMTPTATQPISIRPRLVAVALADQVGSHMAPRLKVAGSG